MRRPNFYEDGYWEIHWIKVKKERNKSAFCRSLWKTVSQLDLALRLARPGALMNEGTPGFYHLRNTMVVTMFCSTLKV